MELNEIMFEYYLRFSVYHQFDENICDDVITVGDCTYLGDRVSSGGGCKAAVTARNMCEWVEFMEYGELLNGIVFL